MIRQHLRLPFAIIASLLLATLASAQTNMGDVVRGKVPLTFIGLDFTQARFITRFDFADLDQQGATYFTRWNGLLESEWEKFNLAAPMKRDDAPTRTNYVKAGNDAVDVPKAWGSAEQPFDPARIPDMVKKYATEDGDGVGCVFIVSEFNKGAGNAIFYVTFFDMKTREVLHSERIDGKPQGFGLRNFWAGAVYDALKQIKGSYFKLWEQKFLKAK